MNLGEIIREYRLSNKMSMSEFARRSGLSKPYVSMLEANKNSNGGKPIIPSTETINKVACVIGITLGELLIKLGDEKVDLRPPCFDEDEVNLLNGYRALTSEGKNMVTDMVFKLNQLLTVNGDKYGIVQHNTYGNN